MRTNRFLACVVALALGAWGCDDNPETDAGLPRDAGGGTDAGTDAATPDEDGGGMTDAGSDAGGDTDAGPPMNFEIRLVNNIPGLTGSTAVPGGFHVCIYFANNTTGAIIGEPRFATMSVGPIPFRGVSPYLAFPSVAPLNYVVALYDPPNLGDPAACPADPNATGAAEAALIATVEPAATPVDSRVTAIATGLVPDTLGASGGALPSVCINPSSGAFNGPCTSATQLVTLIDDPTAPASGMTRVRVSNQIANTPGTTGFTVCYDPSLAPNPPPATGCTDTNPTDTATAVVTAQAYGTVSDYAEQAPVVPTIAAMGVGGGFYLRVEDGMGCTPAFTAGAACYPVVADALRPPTIPADEIRTRLDDGTINTIFLSGLIAPMGTEPYAAAFGASFFVWQDNYVAP